MVVAMPGSGTGNPRPVKLAVIAVQFAAGMAKLAALLTHFAAVLHDFAVDGMDSRIRPSVSQGGSGGNGRGQREERGCQQKLAHRILLRIGSLPCDHSHTMPPASLMIREQRLKAVVILVANCREDRPACHKAVQIIRFRPHLSCACRIGA